MNEKSNRLWVLCELYHPEDNTTGFYMTRLAEGLARSAEVATICGQPSYHRRGSRAAWRERYNGVDIIRVRATTFDKNNLALKLVNMATFTLSALIAALRHFRRGDRVLVVTAPPTLPFAAAVGALARGADYRVIVHDNYPETLVAAGTFSERSAAARLYQIANRWLYKYAAGLVVVGRDMRILVENKLQGLDVPVHFIPNWAETESVVPEDRSENQLLAELGLTDKFVVLYAGNMGYPQDVESVVEASRLLSEEKGIHFLFIGDGSKRPKLEHAIRESRTGNITFIPTRPREEQSVFLNACDVGIVTLIPGMKGVSVPSRTYNLLAAGKPIIGVTEEGSEVDFVIKEERVGFNVPPRCPEMLKEAIFNLYRNPRERLEMGLRARTAAVERYGEPTAIERYTELFAG